ncbi:MAG: hypothetical protein RSB67_03265 [Clostridia bacterium]
MNKLNKNGVSLIALVLTITIMLILISGVTLSYKKINTDAKKKEFAKEVYTLQKLVEEYNFKNNEYPVKNAISVSIQTLDSNSRSQFEKETGYASGTIQLFEIDLAKADVNTITRGLETKPKDKYLVSKTTGKVYYYLGQKIENTIYYTLTDDLKASIGL